jgi:hypothetical protein
MEVGLLKWEHHDGWHEHHESCQVSHLCREREPFTALHEVARCGMYFVQGEVLLWL